MLMVVTDEPASFLDGINKCTVLSNDTDKVWYLIEDEKRQCSVAISRDTLKYILELPTER